MLGLIPLAAGVVGAFSNAKSAASKKAQYSIEAARLGKIADDQGKYFGGLAADARGAGERGQSFYGPAWSAYNRYQTAQPRQVGDLYKRMLGAPPPGGQTRNLMGTLGQGPLETMYKAGAPKVNYSRQYFEGLTGASGALTRGTRGGQRFDAYGATAREPTAMDRFAGDTGTYRTPGQLANRAASSAAMLYGPDLYAARSKGRAGETNPLLQYALERSSESRGPVQSVEDQRGRINAQMSGVTDVAAYAKQLMREQSYAEKQHQAFAPMVAQKGAAERFYDESLGNLETQAYDRYARKLQEDLQRTAAARGNFMSGLVARQEGERVADLRAKQWMDMGNLAQQAQQAQLSRQEQGFGFARGADTSQMARQAHALASGEGMDRFTLGREGLGLQAALGGEQIRTQRMAQGDQLQAQAAEHEMSRRQALDMLAKGSMEQRIQAERVLNDLARAQDESERGRFGDLSNLAREQDQARFARDQELNRLGLSADEEDRARYALGGTLAGDASAEGDRDRAFEFGLAKGASTEQQSRAEFGADLAKFVDTLGENRNKLLADLAQGASNEETEYFKTLLSASLGIGRAQSDTLLGFETLAQGALTEGGRQQFQAQLAAIQIRLQRAGIDQETIKQTLDLLDGAFNPGAAGKK